MTRLAQLSSVQVVSTSNIQLDIFPVSPSGLNIFRFMHSTQNIEINLPSSLLKTANPNSVAVATYHENILSHFSPQGYTAASALLSLDLY